MIQREEIGQQQQQRKFMRDKDGQQVETNHWTAKPRDKDRAQGGIEPLGRQAPLGLKPRPNNSQDHAHYRN
jgi:hypothetical protein